MISYSFRQAVPGRVRLCTATVVISTIAAVTLAGSLSASGASSIGVPPAVYRGAPPAPPVDKHQPTQRSAFGEGDGEVADGTSVFDDNVPGVANLDAALLGALRRAALDASVDGVEFVVTSGWRSPAYQERLLREAISKYGSRKQAARWVATPTTSAHVTGDAVDIGPSDAAAWLSKHGAAYGLCQIYRNERWHYERRPDATDRGCPSMYADPTHDPRMQK
jgi:zinc D-Ala-D-Ala carboxypeptidase